MPRVLITGASGFIASHLANTLQEAHMEVIGISRKFDSLPSFNKTFKAKLGESIDEFLMLERVDTVVHCAFDTSKDSYDTNINGTLKWMNESINNRVNLQIFISSLSAEEFALSDYAKAKFVLEKEFKKKEQIILRLGLVIGNGGIFKKMVDSYRGTPIIPLIDSGRSYVYILGINTLCNILRDCIIQKFTNLKGTCINLHQPTKYMLREIIKTTIDRLGYRRILIPVPSYLMLRMIRLLELIPFIELPISSQNIQGLIQRGQKEVRSDFPQFGYPEETLKLLVDTYAGEILRN